MLNWIVALAAFGLAVACVAYMLFRLKPTLLQLRDAHMRLSEEVVFADTMQPDDAWRNDERRLSISLDKQEVSLKSLTVAFKALKSEVDAALPVIADSSVAIERLDQIEATMARYPSANAAKALSHTRLLSDDAVKRFIEDLCPRLAIEYKERHLYHMAHRVCLLENACHGRLATSIDAILIRQLAAMHLTNLDNSKFRCLEIGTLYGIGAIAIYDAVRFNVENIHLTLIDPLEGYYGEAELDFTSVKPVERAVLEENLKIAGLPKADVTILQDKSQSKRALAATEDKSFDMLIIDGDHSKEGVARDFDNYFHRVRTGGLVVVDDYGVDEWPDIKAYADEKLLPRADVQLVFEGFRTLLLRKV